MARRAPARRESAMGRIQKPSLMMKLYLYESIGMSAYHSDISRLGVGVVFRDVLLDGYVQHLLLGVGRGAGVLPDVLALNNMLFYVEYRRHRRSAGPFDGVATAC